MMMGRRADAMYHQALVKCCYLLQDCRHRERPGGTTYTINDILSRSAALFPSDSNKQSAFHEENFKPDGALDPATSMCPLSKEGDLTESSVRPSRLLVVGRLLFSNPFWSG